VGAKVTGFTEETKVEAFWKHQNLLRLGRKVPNLRRRSYNYHWIWSMEATSHRITPSCEGFKPLEAPQERSRMDSERPS
jgi:hypothetical protein